MNTLEFEVFIGTTYRSGGSWISGIRTACSAAVVTTSSTGKIPARWTEKNASAATLAATASPAAGRSRRNRTGEILGASVLGSAAARALTRAAKSAEVVGAFPVRIVSEIMP